MGGYSVRLVLPGRRAPDPYNVQVEILENGCPWPIVFHFATVKEDDGSLSYKNVGFELRRAGETIDETTAIDDVPAIDSEALERIALNYERYLRTARAVIDWDQPQVDREMLELRRAGRTRRGLSDEFYRRVWADYTAHVRNRGERGAIAAIARAHQSHPSTASRWIARARELYENGGGDDE